MKIATKYTRRAVFIFATALQFLLTTESRADFFKYKDNSGTLIITNRFEDIPKKYRNRVKVVWDAELEAKDSIAMRRNAARKMYEEQDIEIQQAASEKKKPPKGKMLVIELDESNGQLIRRFE